MFSLKKDLRLKTKYDFEIVRKAKKRIYSDGFNLNVRVNECSKPRLGLIITRKQVTRAVDRNYLKRIIRESFRLHQHRLFHFDIIVIVQKHCLQMTHRELRNCLEKLWQKLVTMQAK